MKILSLLLTVCLSIGCLTGCTVDKKPVVEKPEIVDKVEVIEREKVDVESVKNVEVINYSEEDEVFQYLSLKSTNEEVNFENVKETGYTLYPTNEYLIPMDILVDGVLKTIYLQKDSIIGYRMYNEEDLALIFNSTKADLYSAAKPSLMDSLSGAVSDLFESESVDSSIEVYPTEVIDFNTSEYKDVKETGYLSVKNNPLSTFSADVDTASYTNIRKVIKNSLAAEYFDEDEFHDVRIEEMLNYFDYSFSNSETYEYLDGKFAITTEIGDTLWDKDTKLMAVNVRAKDLPKEEHKGSNIVFLIDTSGSMFSYDKLDLLVESLKLLTEQLTEKDTISIVTYASNDRVVIDGVNGSEKEKIIEALESLEAGGSTNGEGGIKKAYEVAEKYKENHSNSRIIMCSDGDLNVGISSEDKLIDLIEKKRETGVYLSVLGFGTGNYKDSKMEALANNGNGNYYYIDTLKEGYKVLVEDLMSTMVTIGDDVKFQLEFNPKYIKGYRKIGYENRNLEDEDFENDKKDAGEVGYGHEVTVIYELVMVDSEKEINEKDLKYQEDVEVDSEDWLTISVRYKEHGEKTSKLIEKTVSEKDYLSENTDDYKFVSSVVGFGLIMNDSEYKNNLEISTVIKELEKLNLSSDENKKELLALVYGYNNIIDYKDVE